MSTVFSRRSFLKYTAVTAVAVAGTSLLGGCSGSGAETAIQTTYPSDNVVLKVKSTLETLEYDPTDGHATFTIHIVNGRKNKVTVNTENPEDTKCPIASLRIIYTPDTEYNEYTANWIISPDTAVPALG